MILFFIFDSAEKEMNKKKNTDAKVMIWGLRLFFAAKSLLGRYKRTLNTFIKRKNNIRKL